MKLNFKTICALLFLLSNCSCQFPADPYQTLNHIKSSKMLIIGTCFAEINNNIKNKEVMLVQKIALSLQAKILWKKGNQEDLYRELRNNNLNLVVCQIRDNSPWKEKLAFTQPYYIDKKNTAYVAAIQQGENAWLKYINDIIQQQGN